MPDGPGKLSVCGALGKLSLGLGELCVAPNPRLESRRASRGTIYALAVLAVAIGLIDAIKIAQIAAARAV
jgi:hypothetical protein